MPSNDIQYPRSLTYPNVTIGKESVRFDCVGWEFAACFFQAAAKVRLTGVTYAQGIITVDTRSAHNSEWLATMISQGYGPVKNPKDWKAACHNDRVPFDQVQWVVVCVRWFLATEPVVRPSDRGFYHISHKGYAG